MLHNNTLLQASLASPSKPQEKSDLPVALSKDVSDLLASIFDKAEPMFKVLSGMSNDIRAEQLAKKLTNLRESIDRKELPKVSFKP